MLLSLSSALQGQVLAEDREGNCYNPITVTVPGSITWVAMPPLGQLTPVYVPTQTFIGPDCNQDGRIDGLEHLGTGHASVIEEKPDEYIQYACNGETDNYLIPDKKMLKLVAIKV